MAAFKTLNSQDVIISPLETNKSFSFKGASALTASNVGIDRFLGTNANFLTNQSTTGQVTQEYQVTIYNSAKQLYYTNYLSGSFGDVSNAVTASFNPDGTITPPLGVPQAYNTIYYNFDETTLNPQKIFSTESIGIISIPSKLYGDNIKPKTFKLESPVSGTLYDDGEGRIKSGSEYVGNIIYEHGIVIITNIPNNIIIPPSISPSPTPTPSPTRTPSRSPSATPSVTPSISISPTPTPSPSITPSITPSISISVTPTPSITPSITPSVTPSITPSITPSVTPSISISSTPNPSPSLTPSVTPSTSPPPISCTLYDVIIEQADLDDATGNTDPGKNNGTLYVDYIACNGTPTTTQYSVAGTFQICVQELSFPAPNIYYYKNNNQTSPLGGSSVSDTLTSCTPPS